MNRMRHGKLSIDLPKDWSDQSTLLFVGPAPTLMTAQRQRVPQPSVAITMVRAKGDDPIAEARAILDEELSGLRAMPVGLEISKIDESFETKMGIGVLSTHRLTLDGVRIVQLHAVVVTGQIAFRAVASSGELESEESLKGLLASLSMDGAP